MILLKDDLVKAGPFKRDRQGIPTEESIIKLHAVIFKHSQKRIIVKELEYQKKRIKLLKEKKMNEYLEVVRRSDIEYRRIEKYVTEKALYVMNLDHTLY